MVSRLSDKVIFSEPIMTMCYDMNGNIIPTDKVALNFNNTFEFERLERHGIVTRRTTNFMDSIMSTCYFAKIYGYLEIEEMTAWNKYFELLFSQNPNVVDAHAHFFCSSEHIPYVLCGNRNDRKTKVCVGELNNALYTTVNLNDEENPFSFSKRMYKNVVANYQKIFWNNVKEIKIEF